MHEDIAQILFEKAGHLGASFAEVRFEDTTREFISYVNGRITSLGNQKTKGASIRVIYEGGLGFASTYDLSTDGLLKALEEAVKIARSLSGSGKKLATVEPYKKSFKIENVKNHPSQAELTEKIGLVKRIYSYLSERKVSSSIARYGSYYGVIEVYTSDGLHVSAERLVTGISATAVIRENGKVGDSTETYGASLGLEAFTGENSPENIAEKAYENARLALKASRPPAGLQTVITRPELTGVFAHESFGHLTEGDGIFAGSSPLVGRLGEKLASEQVTIVDSGYDERGGYVFLVDDEGVPTRRTVLVENGILKGYLHSRESAALTGMEPTGNGRAQSFEHDVIVRMRNTFFEAGDWKEEEIIADTKNGLLLDKPAGGQVEEDGTFTFNARIGFIIENGEIKEPVRDVVLAGNILEMLRYIDAVGKNVEISTSPFGGCGKWGQMVHVGDGGSTLRVSRLLVGGEK
ncbi:MAG: TldD/PmbA family protein [Thermofilum sp.]|jgi:TldD protein|nr:TldD/PmbA family protein [Thermofilum sp.]